MKTLDQQLEDLREAVLARHQELMARSEAQSDLKASIDALEEVTQVPRTEIEALAARIFGRCNLPEHNSPLEQMLGGEAFFPPEVREALRQLPAADQEEFLVLYRLNAKGRGLAFFFALLPPPLSAHYLYLGRWWLQIPYSLTLGGCFLWWLVDLFRVSSMTYQANRQLARRLWRQLDRKAHSK
ncbi:MAG: TM2 domain-containing protein [bacterium]|nr:TM2 domain-containing protein [bacterium]